MAKKLSIEEIYPIVESYSTADQKLLKEFLEKTLDEKAKAAKEEIKLIEG